MATYQGNNYASDVYLVDTSTGAVTRGTEIGIRVDYDTSYYSGAWHTGAAYKKAVFVYGGAAAGMGKKRRLGKASGPYVYVTSYDGGYQLINCYFTSGSSMANFMMDVPYTFYEYLTTRQEYANYAVPGLSINTYNNFTQFRTSEIYANQGVIGDIGGHEADSPRIVGNVLATIQTHLGANRPYIVENYEDVTPYITNCYPTSGFVSDQSPATFGWTFGYDASGVTDAIAQGSAKFRWREAGAGSYTEIAVSGAQSSITVPAGTFTASNIEWQVVVTSDDGIESAPSAWYAFTVVDFVSTARPVSPVNVYAEVDKPIIFSWQHIIGSGTPQTKAELQYMVDGGSWQALATVNGAAQSITIAANTLPAGRISWRVRTYNTDNIAGAWSTAAAFVGIGTPQPPSITGITDSARPTISWQAVGQVAYQVRIRQDGAAGYVYETGQISGIDKLHKVTAYLYNSSYTAYVRILNASLWSDWSGIGFTVAVTPPITPTITAEVIPGGARVTIPPASAAHVYLHRNGMPVADVTGITAYDDYAALGRTVYAVRVIDADDAFADGNLAAVTVAVTAAQIAAVDALDAPVRLLLTRGGPRKVSGGLAQDVTYQTFAGRSRPLATFSGAESESYSLSVSFLDAADRDALYALMRRRMTCLYRDQWGNRWYAVLGAADIAQDRIATDLTLTLTVVDYVEGIEV